MKLVSKDCIGVTTLYEVSTDSNLTEGRDWKVHVAFCASPTTAKRLARGIGVQGTDGYVDEVTVYYINGRWHAPIIIKYSSHDDIVQDELDNRRQAALEKARAAGLTDEELDLLTKQ